MRKVICNFIHKECSETSLLMICKPIDKNVILFYMYVFVQLFPITKKKSPYVQKKPDEASAEKLKIIDSQSVFAKMKPKRMSRALKKDIAKQSITNIVAAGTCNFDTFKNDFLDKQLGAVVKRKKKKAGGELHPELKRDMNDESHRLSTGNRTNSIINGSGYPNATQENENNFLRNCDLSGNDNSGGSSSNERLDDQSSGVSSPFSDESILSPSSDISIHSSSSIGHKDSSPNFNFIGSPLCGEEFIDSQKISLTVTQPLRKPVILPSISFTKGKEVNFITVEQPNANDSKPSSGVTNSTDFSTVRSELSNMSGLLVDYSTSDSD